MADVVKFMVDSENIVGLKGESERIYREISLDKSKVERFAAAYYPLNDTTIPTFIKGMSKKRKEKLLASFPKRRCDINVLFENELDHCLEIAEGQTE